MRRRRTLSREERRLWGEVARSTRPLAGRAALEPEEAEQPQAARAGGEGGAPPPAAANAGAMQAVAAAVRRGAAAPALPALHPIERPVRRKLGRGRLPIEDRIDLHGRTEAMAHFVLLAFLRRAQAEGLRHVLVITGRGASFGSSGVLKRALPHWFSTAEFRSLVAGFEAAERQHGGEGAFYVRIRRR